MAPQVVIDATKSHLQCLEPLSEWVCALKHLVLDYKVLIPTRMDLGATTLLKMLKTLLMVMKTLEMVLKPLWMMVNPYMGWRSINDPFCGHSCSDGVMVS